MEKIDLDLISMDIFQYMYRIKNSFDDIIMPITQEYGLTPLSAVVLFMAGWKQDMTVGTVNQCLNINQGNLSTMCKKLEDKGLLTRTRDKKDERVVKLSPTKQGEKILREIEEKLRRTGCRLLELPEEEILKASEGLKAFAELLEKVQDAQ